jgi:hypothetical protein
MQAVATAPRSVDAGISPPPRAPSSQGARPISQAPAQVVKRINESGPRPISLSSAALMYRSTSSSSSKRRRRSRSCALTLYRANMGVMVRIALLKRGRGRRAMGSSARFIRAVRAGCAILRATPCFQSLKLIFLQLAPDGFTSRRPEPRGQERARSSRRRGAIRGLAKRAVAWYWARSRRKRPALPVRSMTNVVPVAKVIESLPSGPEYCDFSPYSPSTSGQVDCAAARGGSFPWFGHTSMEPPSLRDKSNASEDDFARQFKDRAVSHVRELGHRLEIPQRVG